MDIKDIKKEDIEGYDCRFATYCKSNTSNNDLLVVKEYVVTKDHKRIPNLRKIENYKREFYVTHESFRNHKQKKEYEEEKRLKKFTCTQAELPSAVARALGMPGIKFPLKQMASSPYLYGTDIHTTSLVKKQYQDRWKSCIGPNSTVAVMDIETDVINGTEEPIAITLSFKERVYTVVSKRWIGSMVDPIAKIHQAIDTYLADEKKTRNITFEVEMFDNAGACCKAIFDKAHQWMPDIVCYWNINFDLPRIMKTLIQYNYSLEDTFSDPSVPFEYRFFKYIEGPSQKVTQSGKVLPLHWTERWHTVKCPASFYLLDAACVYRRLRLAKGQEPGYSLDAVLQRNIKRTKLKFKELDGVSKLEWHVQMQQRYKAEYVAYNIFDCIGVELLDEKTGDLSQAFAALCELSDYGDFKSNPRRIINDLNYFYREHGKVIASCPPEVVEELDKYVVSMEEWILTLPAHMSDDNGLAIIRELPSVKAMMRIFLADLDIEGTYPNIESTVNISKETTIRELSSIDGVPLHLQRFIGINLTGGITNAVEICQNAFHLPSPSQWLEEYKKEKIAA